MCICLLFPCAAYNPQEAASKLLPYVQTTSSPTDRIFSTHMFNRQAAAALHLESELGDKDFKVLLKYLARDRQVIVYDDRVGIADAHLCECEVTCLGCQDVGSK